MGVMAEAWSGCAMVGASSWVAKWCGKALALWLLGELGVPPKSVRSFMADNTGATYGEDSGRTSRCPWGDVLRLRCTAALLQGGAVEIYMPAQHNCGSRSPVAMVQARSAARAKQGMLAAEKGCVPFPEWLGGHFCLMWHGGVVCSQPIPRLFWKPAILGLMFSSLVCPPGFPPHAWVRCVESGRVSLQSLSATFWLRTAPHGHVEPEPVLTCHFCWRACVSWGPICGTSV